MALKAVRLEPVPASPDPDTVEDPILRQQILDGVEPAAQFFEGAAPREIDQFVPEAQAIDYRRLLPS